MKKIDRPPDRTAELQPVIKKAKENRWCDKDSCFIDVGACQARAKIKLRCSRCMKKWRQPLLPFADLT